MAISTISGSKIYIDPVRTATIDTLSAYDGLSVHVGDNAADGQKRRWDEIDDDLEKDIVVHRLFSWLRRRQ